MNVLMLKKAEALDLLDSEEGILRNRIIDHGRWSVTHEVIFKRHDRLWRMTYRRPATEMQDESPFEYEDEVQCVEVQRCFTTDFRILP